MAMSAVRGNIVFRLRLRRPTWFFAAVLGFLCCLDHAHARGLPSLRLSLRGGNFGSEQQEERDFSKLKLADLQKELRARGLSAKGLKGELIERLQENIQTEGGEQVSSSKRAASAMDEVAESAAASASLQAKQPRLNEPTELERKGADLVQNVVEDATAASPSPPGPVIRIDDDNEVSFVKVYNSYPIKDKCRAAGFRWDADERAWIQPVTVIMQAMGELDRAALTQERVLEMIQNADPATPPAVAEKTELQPGEGLKVEVSEESNTVMVKGEGTYAAKELLRAVGFRWNRDLYCWARPKDQVETQLRDQGTAGWDGEEEFAEAVVELVKRAPPAAANEITEKPPPDLLVDKEEVVVRNSYDIKDHLRGLGFTFNKELRAWTASVEHCLTLSEELNAVEDINLPALMALDPSVVRVSEAAKPAASLKIVDGDVLVFNSYAMREQLRALGFRWDQEEVAWRKGVMEVQEQLGVVDEGEVTVEALVEVGQSVAGSGAEAQQATVRTEDGEVRVFNSYSEKDTLRALGFRWNAEGAYWGKMLEELKAMPGAEGLAEVGQDGAGLSMEALRCIPAMAPGEGAREGKAAPYMMEEDGMVMVFNSYDVKDQLRRVGMRWDAERGCWAGSGAELRELMGVHEGELTLQQVLSWEGGAGGEQGAWGSEPRMELVDDEVLVHNSYAAKDHLRALDFRYDGDRRVWAKSMVEVKQMLQLEDQADISLDKILALQPSPAQDPVPDEQQPLAGAQDSTPAARPPLRSPSPHPVDETPGENLLSDMAQSLQGWSASAHGVSAQST